MIGLDVLGASQDLERTGYIDQTTLHPLGLVAVIVLGGAMILLPRRHAVLPLLVMACFVAPAQRIVVMTLDFDLVRVMVVGGWARLLLRGELKAVKLNSVDRSLIVWAFLAVVIYGLGRGTVGAVIYRVGTAFDALGLYFLFRALIRDWRDIDRLVLGLIWICCLVCVAFAAEYTTSRNAFSVFGGVPELTSVREGRLRCRGAFAHPILAGSFWASLVPLFCARWWGNAHGRVLAVVGALSAVAVVFMCGSSGPVFSLAACVLGGCAFMLRNRMRAVRWTLAFGLIALHLIMNAPVYHLISRVAVVGGSAGHHRYRLIHAAVERFWEWAAVGTVSTAHWGSRLFDVTNAYILEGVRGGIITLGCFVLVPVLAFRRIGLFLRTRHLSRMRLVVVWAMGVCIWVHMVNFVSVSYFGQTIIVWYLALALAGGLPYGGEGSNQKWKMRRL